MLLLRGIEAGIGINIILRKNIIIKEITLMSLKGGRGRKKKRGSIRIEGKITKGDSIERRGMNRNSLNLNR